jgi:replication factor A1
MKPNNILTKNVIRDLFSDNSDKKVLYVDYKMQVISIKKNEQTQKANSQNHSIYSCCLSDGEYKYTGFILFKDNSESIIEEGDILKLTTLSATTLNNSKSRVFIVKKFDVVEKKYPIIGEPELWKDETMSKERIGTSSSNVLINSNNNVSNNNVSNNPTKTYITNAVNPPFINKNNTQIKRNNNSNVVNLVDEDDSNKNLNNNIVNNNLNNNIVNNNLNNNPNNNIVNNNLNNNPNNNIVNNNLNNNPNNNIVNNNLNNNPNKNINNNTFNNIHNNMNNNLNNNMNNKISSNVNHHHIENRPKPTKYYVPLSQLTTFSKDVQLLVRCVKKGELKNWNSNQRGGCLFSFTIIDADGNEMQVTAFNKACDKFYNVIKENCVYEIIGGFVRMNEKKYTSVKSDYKIIIDEHTKIEQKEDDGTIQEHKINPVKISELFNYPVYSVVDVYGYVLEPGEKFTKSTRIGEQAMRRLIIADDSEYKIELTLWKHFTNLNIKKGQVLGLKSVKVGDFNGRNLSSIDDSLILIDPPTKEAIECRVFCENFKGEFKSGGIGKIDTQNTQYNNILYIKEVLDFLNIDGDDKQGDKAPLCKIKATVCNVNHAEKNYYAGCPEPNCKKKLAVDTYGYQCLNCGKPVSNPTYYYTFSLRVKDASSEHWIDIFGNIGDKLFNVTAEQYKDIIIAKDETRLNEISNNLDFKTFYFVVKPKIHVYQNVPKKKLNVYRVDSVDTLADAKRILRALGGLIKH